MAESGKFKLSAVNFGFFRLDGGSMFGSVPKNIWSKRLEADSDNCIRLATRSLLIEQGSRCFLIDAGMGTKWNDKLSQIYGVNNTPDQQWGFDRHKVTDLILTHLHFDHAGGATRYSDANKNKLELSFANATIHLQKDNLANAKAPTIKERASYLKENWGPLESGKLNLISGNTEIFPGIKVHQVNGHTIGQQWIEINSGAQTIFYPTDLIPTSHHVPLPFHMGYDTCASTLLREKEEFLNQAVKRKAIVFYQHDPAIPATYIEQDDKGGYLAGPAIPNANYLAN